MASPAAIVVAGGAARRFGGVDKLRHVVDGRPVLRRVLDALGELGVDPVTVVGPRRPGIDDGCTVVQEQPPGSGPLAAIAAGLDALPSWPSTVFIVAGDLPHLTASALQALGGAFAIASSVDAAIAVDATGQLQHLLAIWRRDPLERAVAGLGTVAGRPVHALTNQCKVYPVPLAAPAGMPAPWIDLDGPDRR